MTICAITSATTPYGCDLLPGHDGDMHSHRGEPFAAGNATDRELHEARQVLACFPPGLLSEVAAILRDNPHGVGPTESGGGQTSEDHLSHAIDHVYGVAMGDESEPHLTHAIARLVLARAIGPAASGEGR